MKQQMKKLSFRHARTWTHRVQLGFRDDAGNGEEHGHGMESGMLKGFGVTGG